MATRRKDMSMNQRDCFANEEELNVYLDGELTGRRREDLDRHLLSCRDCTLRYEISLRLKNLVRESCLNEQAPAFLRNRILEGIRREDEPAAGFWSYLIGLFRHRPLLPAGAAAVMVFLLFLAIFSRPAHRNTMPLVTEMVHEHYEYLEEPGKNGIESDDPAQISRWLSANAGSEYAVLSISKLPSLKVACVLDEDDETIGYVGFDYLDKRLSLFLVDEPGNELFGPEKFEVHDVSVYCGNCTGMNYALWQDGNITCILVGDVPEESMMDLAGQII